tara:strand:- start:2606 stop:2890 length:285 start_codon:yes stop_codon:yes gene_type:complete
MADDFLDIPKTDETQQATPEEHYFSRSKNQWLMVSDMSDMHVRRAFKRLLRMIRLNQLVEVDDVSKNTIYQVKITEELNKIKAHCDEIRRVVDE